MDALAELLGTTGKAVGGIVALLTAILAVWDKLPPVSKAKRKEQKAVATSAFDKLYDRNDNHTGSFKDEEKRIIAECLWRRQIAIATLSLLLITTIIGTLWAEASLHPKPVAPISSSITISEQFYGASENELLDASFLLDRPAIAAVIELLLKSSSPESPPTDADSPPTHPENIYTALTVNLGSLTNELPVDSFRAIGTVTHQHATVREVHAFAVRSGSNSATSIPVQYDNGVEGNFTIDLPPMNAADSLLIIARAVPPDNDQSFSASGLLRLSSSQESKEHSQ